MKDSWGKKKKERARGRWSTLRHFKELAKRPSGACNPKARAGKRYTRQRGWSCGVISLSKIDDVIADFQAASPTHRIGRSARVRAALLLLCRASSFCKWFRESLSSFRGGTHLTSRKSSVFCLVHTLYITEWGMGRNRKEWQILR